MKVARASSALWRLQPLLASFLFLLCAGAIRRVFAATVNSVYPIPKTGITYASFLVTSNDGSSYTVDLQTCLMIDLTNHYDKSSALCMQTFVSPKVSSLSCGSPVRSSLLSCNSENSTQTVVYIPQSAFSYNGSYVASASNANITLVPRSYRFIDMEWYTIVFYGTSDQSNFAKVVSTLPIEAAAIFLSLPNCKYTVGSACANLQSSVPSGQTNVLDTCGSVYVVGNKTGTTRTFYSGKTQLFTCSGSNMPAFIAVNAIKSVEQDFFGTISVTAPALFSIIPGKQYRPPNLSGLNAFLEVFNWESNYVEYIDFTTCDSFYWTQQANTNVASLVPCVVNGQEGCTNFQSKPSDLGTFFYSYGQQSDPLYFCSKSGASSTLLTTQVLLASTNVVLFGGLNPGILSAMSFPMSSTSMFQSLSVVFEGKKLWVFFDTCTFGVTESNDNYYPCSDPSKSNCGGFVFKSVGARTIVFLPNTPQRPICACSATAPWQSVIYASVAPGVSASVTSPSGDTALLQVAEYLKPVQIPASLDAVITLHLNNQTVTLRRSTCDFQITQDTVATPVCTAEPFKTLVSGSGSILLKGLRGEALAFCTPRFGPTFIYAVTQNVSFLNGPLTFPGLVNITIVPIAPYDRISGFLNETTAAPCFGSQNVKVNAYVLASA